MLTALIPDTVEIPIELSTAVELARENVLENRNDGDRDNVLTLAACLYRAGSYEEAGKLLGEAVEALERAADPAQRSNHACGLYFLSMTREKLNQPVQARRYLEEAAQVAKHTSDSSCGGRAIGAALNEEARQLIDCYRKPESTWQPHQRPCR